MPGSLASQPHVTEVWTAREGAPGAILWFPYTDTHTYPYLHPYTGTLTMSKEKGTHHTDLKADFLLISRP